MNRLGRAIALACATIFVGLSTGCEIASNIGNDTDDSYNTTATTITYITTNFDGTVSTNEVSAAQLGRVTVSG